MATILVVDDEEIVRTYFRQVLTDAAYEVVLAKNGADALAKLKDHPVDFVLMDLVMPDQEGIETIATLRAERPELKIVAISGKFGGMFLTVAKSLGANATLAKPVSPDELLATIRKVLAACPDPKIDRAD